MKHFPRIEALEARIAPAVLTLSLSAAGKLTVTGTGSPDFNIYSITAGGVTTYYLQGFNALEDTTFALGKTSAGVTLSTSPWSPVANDGAAVVGVKSLAISLGNGVNAVSLGNTNAGLSLTGDLSITGGNAADKIEIGAGNLGVTVGKTFTVKLNKGDDSLAFLGTGTSSFGKTLIDMGTAVAQNASKEISTGDAGTLTFTDSLTITSGAMSNHFSIGKQGGNVSVAKSLTIGTVASSSAIFILGDEVTVGGDLAVSTKVSPLFFGSGGTLKIAGDTSLTVKGGIAIKGGDANNTTISSGDLEITKGVTIAGGVLSDTVLIDSAGGKIGGKVSVAGGKGTNSTTLSSSAAPGLFTAHAFSVSGLDGKDTVVLDSGYAGAISLSLGTGNSDVTLKDTSVDAVSIKTAGVALATDKLTLDGLVAFGAVSITHGAGDSTIDIRHFEAMKAFTLKMGAGTNALNISSSAGSGVSLFDGSAAISGGIGADTVVIGRTKGTDAGNFKGKLTVALGAGTDTVNGDSSDIAAIATLQVANTFGVIKPVVTGVLV